MERDKKAIGAAGADWDSFFLKSAALVSFNWKQKHQPEYKLPQL